MIQEVGGRGRYYLAARRVDVVITVSKQSATRKQHWYFAGDSKTLDGSSVSLLVGNTGASLD